MATPLEPFCFHAQFILYLKDVLSQAVSWVTSAYPASIVYQNSYLLDNLLHLYF